MSNRVISPEQIRDKVVKRYPRYLDKWVRGELKEFFPVCIPPQLKLSVDQFARINREIETLRAASKEARGVGYTVHWETRRSRSLGTNRFPARLTIDTAEDLLELAGRTKDFARTAEVVRRVRAELPRLEDWLRKQVRTLARYADRVEGLIAVARYFIEHPWPDCYARQVPVAVDTKFIERNQAVLRQWLDELLPADAIRADERDFFPRFGLRDGQPHWAIRVLDARLQNELELPLDELSLPMRSLGRLQVRDATVVIVENRTNLMTLPGIARGLGMRGEGKAVTRFRDLAWLDENKIVYWGDLDVEGFQILSSLRGRFPHVRSLLMDMATLEAHGALAIEGTGARPDQPAHLTPAETEAFERCRAENVRLEQEKIPQSAVDAAFSAVAPPRR